jgi:hypothetical protein
MYLCDPIFWNLEVYERNIAYSILAEIYKSKSWPEIHCGLVVSYPRAESRVVRSISAWV